jgi:hypothetical protein
VCVNSPLVMFHNLLCIVGVWRDSYISLHIAACGQRRRSELKCVDVRILHVFCGEIVYVCQNITEGWFEYLHPVICN